VFKTVCYDDYYYSYHHHHHHHHQKDAKVPAGYTSHSKTPRQDQMFKRISGPMSYDDGGGGL